MRPPDIARAYRIVREVFVLPALWKEIEALDNKVPAAVQTGMLLEIAGADRARRRAGCCAATGSISVAKPRDSRPRSRHLSENFPELLPASDRQLAARITERFAAAGVPAALALRVGQLGFLTTALEIARAGGASTAQPLDRTARIYYGAGARFALDEMRAAAQRLPAETSWQKQAADAVVDDLFTVQGDLAALVLRSKADGADPVAAWADSRAAALAPAELAAAELRATAMPDLAMLVVASRQLRQALG